MVKIDEAATTKRLAAWAGIFAVATALVGVWGMNFDHLPELQWKWGYPATLGVIAGACSFVFWRFKRAGWLLWRKNVGTPITACSDKQERGGGQAWPAGDILRRQRRRR